MSKNTIECWRCGVAVAVEQLPLRREEVCAGCDADLRVCKLCTFFNPSVSDGCDEPVAGGVTNKERANFCDYFTPLARAFSGSAATGSAVPPELDALFGGIASNDQTTSADDPHNELARLFGLDKS